MQILIPQPGIEPKLSAVRAQSPNHWTTREFPRQCLMHKIKHRIQRKPITHKCRFFHALLGVDGLSVAGSLKYRATCSSKMAEKLLRRR